MAIIQQPTESGFEIGALAPAGTYVATCLEIDDQFSVDRPKFEDPQETEQLDVTRFLFGCVDSKLVEVDLVVINFRDGRGANPGESTKGQQSAD